LILEVLDGHFAGNGIVHEECAVMHGGPINEVFPQEKAIGT
jgi:hypothetical protein